MLSKQGKIEAILRLINTGVNDPFIYDLVIEICSELGMFKVALHLFDEMSERKLNPGFNTFASVLNSGCRYKNDEMIIFAMESMAGKGWKEAEELAGLALQESVFLEASCCGLLIKRYCKRGQIDLAIDLHNQMEKKGYAMDSSGYNALINGLLEAVRVEEAERIFGYMRVKNLLPSESFVIMINGFCRENELRKGMNLHDEMVEMGLKPSAKMYRRLICNFR
ncbi:hypothetical protein L1987_38350 [Smallanthus sonchifolius]|uniref:Uncharacterized protein n=1 Tax=Smallanthus sonchifolius TaxID=185202 RepID=A0ACB9HK40_9ASTR|nr:hypothetical protein L1987_38350 [Smallanthus sonchifolius]